MKPLWAWKALINIDVIGTFEIERVADERHNGVKLPVLLNKFFKEDFVSFYERYTVNTVN